MVSETLEKAVLASAKRLGSASAGEIAADLGASTTEILPIVAELASRKYLAKLTRGSSVTPSGSRRLSDEEMRDAAWEVTSRGALELNT